MKRAEWIPNLGSAILVGASILGLAGCSRVNAPGVEAAGPNGAGPSGSPISSIFSKPPVVIPAGTTVRVRLEEAIDTARNRSGDSFGATLDEPIVSGDRVIIPKGTKFAGHVVESKPSGRFKGRAVLALKLDSFDLNGKTYMVDTNDPSRVSAGHKKHNLLWIGGGSGGGAAIGAIAGGPAGALIGAGAGAAAGTAGSAITGRREIHLPVETPVTFQLEESLSIG